LAKGFNRLFKQVFNLFKITREINMKRTLLSFSVLGAMLATGMTQAGGWDRSGQDTSIILKEGSLLEVTSVSVKPKVTGIYTTAGIPDNGKSTSDGVPNYSLTTMGFRTEISDNMSLAIIQDTPFGAEVNWTSGTAGYSFVGIKAKVKSSATTLLMGYDLDNVTVYGGLKSQSFSASATNPLVGAKNASNVQIGDGTGYSISSTTDSSIGYVFGAAIEKPEIAMRVALTYHSKVSHDVSVVEKVSGNTFAAAILSADTPESFNLDFQTGIAANTLLFGTIRQVKWIQTKLSPVKYTLYSGGKDLKKFTSNTTSYTLGLGRKFSDDWSGAVTYGTESAEGVNGSPLGPTDGYSKMGLGVTYTGEQATITLGMQKINMGDTTAAAGALMAAMASNTALVTALKIGYKF
jgi:long-chain fatty acid transport protein